MIGGNKNKWDRRDRNNQGPAHRNFRPRNHLLMIKTNINPRSTRSMNKLQN